METVLNRLKNFDCFSHLDRRSLIDFSSSIAIVSLQNKDSVFVKGESIEYIYLVVAGSVKIQDTVHASKTKIFNFLGRGEFLGVAMAGLPNPIYPATAVCNEDSSFLKIPLVVLFEMILRVPRVRSEVNRQISERFLEFQNDICRSHRLVPYRLANFLLRLTDRQSPEFRRLVQIPLTRSDIAQRIGAEVETVIRIMSLWTKNGWIITNERHIEIIDRSALEAIDSNRLPRKYSRSKSATRNISRF